MELDVLDAPRYVPKVRDDVVVESFDSSGGDARYLVFVDRKYFVASTAVVQLLGVLSSDRLSFRDAASLVNQRLGTELTEAELTQRIDELPPALFRDDVADQRSPLLLKWRFLGAGVLEPFVAPATALFARTPALVAIAMLLLVDAAMAFLALDGGAPRMYAASWLSATAITLFGTLLHELGHVSACAKFGARHDGIGVGLYWLWPTFYSEVHDAWRLPKLQRAVVDAGGIYFQGIYAVLLGLAALATGEPTLWLACWFSHYLMLHTLNPVLKFDGYWLLSDLSGSYNLHARIKQIWGRVFRAVARRGGEWPGRWEMALLLGFTAFAAVYFWFVANFLCANIVSLSLELWDWGWGTGPAGSALTGWGVAGKTLGLGLMLMFAWGLARGIGRSLHAVARQ